MILPMKKYSFVVYHKEIAGFLKDLQNFGVLHIIEMAEADSNINNYKIQLSQFENVLKSLTKRKKLIESAKVTPAELSDLDNGRAIFEEIVKLQSENEQVSQQLQVLNKEIRLWEPWGEFTSYDREKLSSAGIDLRFYQANVNKLTDDFRDRFAVEEISQAGKTVSFVVFNRIGEADYPDFEEVKLPENSFSALQSEYQIKTNRKNEINALLDSFAFHALAAVQKSYDELSDLSELERAGLNSISASEQAVRILQGWIPEEKEIELQNYLDENGLVYLSEKPEVDEYANVPILLRNNSFAKLFEPIGKLFSLPNYGELDLTPLFAPFFMLFFGLCLGDAGYGVVMFVAATIAKFRLKPDLKPILSLVQFLGVSTTFAGAMTGTVFGFALVDLGFSKNLQDMVLTPENMFYLAIGIGVVQIVFGLIVKAFNIAKQNNFMATLPTVGWLIMLVSLLAWAFLPVGKPVTFVLIWVGLAVLMLFSTTGNIFKRLGLGIWDMYNNITGVFGDALSYIRLFALGLSGSILGMVINSIGGIFLDIPYVGWLIWIVFLIIGHTGNLLLCSLGSFVHPMRLTFVEFYKNSGWSGGGKEYRPFSKKC